jgi:hypothetical protein
VYSKKCLAAGGGEKACFFRWWNAFFVGESQKAARRALSCPARRALGRPWVYFWRVSSSSLSPGRARLPFLRLRFRGGARPGREPAPGLGNLPASVLFPSPLLSETRARAPLTPMIGRLAFPLSSFLSAAFCRLFSLLLLCASGRFSASGSLHFFCQSLPISHLFPPATRPARLISAFPIFFIHPPRVLFIPISGTPASASGAKVYSPVFFPFFLRTPRSFCSLSASLLSRALLLSSRLLSFSVSFSPPLLISFFSAPPPLLLSSSAPPGAYQCLARRGPPNSLSHTCEHVAARTDEKHRMEHPWNILTRGESYQNHHRGKQGRNPGKVTLPSSLVSASPQAACRSSACTARLRGHAQRPHQFTPRPRPSARTCPRREARAGTRQRAAAATRAAHAARRAPTRRSRWPPRAWCQIGRAI